jgi:hypothetical protein
MKKISLYLLMMFVMILISCRKKGNEPIPISPNPKPVIESPPPPVAMAADKKDGIAVKPGTDSVGIKTDAERKKSAVKVSKK